MTLKTTRPLIYPHTAMRALHLFATIALSLCAAAYDAPRPRRRDVGTAVPGNEVDVLGVPNRDLTVLSTSNTSDAHSLNVNRKRTLDDPRLVRRGLVYKISLKLADGRLTGAVSFNGKSESKVIFDTKSNVTWVQSGAPSYFGTNTHRPRLHSYRFMGSRHMGVVKVDMVSSSEMPYHMVSDETAGCRGGLALDRSAVGWLKFISVEPVFAFYSRGSGNREFHLGGLDKVLREHVEWHEVRANDIEWTLQDKAHIKVDGKVQVENIITVIDTGVEYIYGPGSEVRKVYEPLGGKRSLQGLWGVPCNKPPPVVTFSWAQGETDFPIDDFVVQGKVCFGRIQEDNSLPPNNWLIGVPFLHGKYAAFDKLNGKAGFALLDKVPK